MTEIPTRISVISVILLCCIVVTAPIVVLAQGGIQSVEISGDGVIMEEDGVTYLWDDESYEVSIRFQDYPDQDNYIVCLDKYMDGSEELCRDDWSPARGAVAFVEGVREHESAMDGQHSRG